MRFSRGKVLFLVLATSVACPVVRAGTIEGRVHVGTAGRELADFVISVEDIGGRFPPPSEVAVMDQKDLRFVPHVLAIPVGAIVEFPNSDPLAHNVFSISPAKRFNLGLYQRGAVRRIKFDEPGLVELLCHVHLEMSAYIVVLKNPYFARTGPDGTFRIPNVPAGQHRLRCWHERFPAQEHSVRVPEAGVAPVDFLVMG